MIHPWHDVTPGEDIPHEFNAVIEIPFGSSVKYELDKESGLMTMIDGGKKDHKIIAVATEDPEYNSYREASEMPPHRITMLRRFFLDYKHLEGKQVEVEEIQSAANAYPVIEDALARYSRQRRRGFKI